MMKYLNESTKKMLMILLGIVVVFVVVLVGILIYKGITGNKVTYDRLRTITEESAKKYLEEKQLLPVTEGDMVTVGIDTLVSYDYMKPLTKLTDEENCTGKVTVTNNGGFYLYNTYVDCKDKETTTLNDVIKKNVVTADAGLYKVENQYYFRGEFVDNYVKFAGVTWRIIKIDEKGNLKLVKQSAEKGTYSWDDRYNSDTGKNSGINDYAVSRIRETLNGIYYDGTSFSDIDKKYIVANNVCIGKRKESDTSINEKVDCSSVIEKEYLNLITTFDIPFASIDKNCSDKNEMACQNYNYFSNFFASGWTSIATSDNTNKVFSMVGGMRTLNEAKSKSSIRLVLYISGENVYQNGDGTEENPYIIS